MRIFKNTHFDFMGSRKLAFLISGTLIAISLASLIWHGGPHFSIDFKGGTFVELQFVDKNNPTAEINIPIEDVRAAFAQEGVENAEIKHYGSPQEISVQMGVDDDYDALKNQIYADLQAKFPNYTIEERRVESVGPKIGSELVGDAVWAILFSMLLILIYIMFRFEFRFGVGAVLALFHDITITLGFFSLTDLEISVPIIAAILTIIGYSLNDTIVVYDRIRENMKTFKRKTSGFSEMVNRSINETLSRTIVTSGTTLIVVIVLYFFGGEIIRDFAIALILGIIVGTYSSVFIASPVLVEWESRKNATKATVKKK